MQTCVPSAVGSDVAWEATGSGRKVMWRRYLSSCFEQILQATGGILFIRGEGGGGKVKRN